MTIALDRPQKTRSAQIRENLVIRSLTPMYIPKNLNRQSWII